MRITVLILVLLLLNCEDKQSSKKSNRSASDSTATEIGRKQDTVETPDEPFKLTDQNAIPFLAKYGKENKENKVRITTDFGIIDVELFSETKYHRANFIFLTKKHYFDYTQFYRVVPNFVIQGGNSDNPEIAQRRTNIGLYLLPKDAQYGFKHDRGVLSMPSSEIENPYKLASPYEFFIVVQEGGAHHLDGDYTVFGKVISGMEVVDQISKQKTDSREWPLENIYIQKVEILN
ncbi:MAG: peptidylprolyl isomerase [Mangrovimonas sp.]|nr:peptidylprolyl isomerase [Mangrovimonas sp.]HPF96615.1 peptidylprolyl isomerase [Mangrovimonas sp.]